MGTCCGVRTCRCGGSGIPCWPPPSGTLLTCFAVVALTVPYQFAGGGVLGLALISNYAWGISPAWVLSVGNAVLLLWGWKALSLRFALWTLYVTVLTSVAIPVFELFQYPVIGNTILAALLAGAVGGVGFGMLFRVGASSGGTDVIVMVARKRWGVDIGSMSFYINVVILFASFVVVDIEKILMGGLLLYVETVTIDRVLKSFDRRSQVLIISKRTQDIADFILNELDRSATIIPAKGAYSDRPHDMLLVVLTRRQTVGFAAVHRGNRPGSVPHFLRCDGSGGARLQKLGVRRHERMTRRINAPGGPRPH